MKLSIAFVAALVSVFFVLGPSTSSADPPKAGDNLLSRARGHLSVLQQGTRPPLGVSSSLEPADWAGAIDEIWGPGLSTQGKLEVFDGFWKTVDEELATFQGIEDVDWHALRDKYRPEVAAGVSRGRFAAIMNVLSIALRESHTMAMDVPVNFLTLPQPGVPLFWIGPWFENTFGACVTAQDDGSALVFDVVDGHPLGLSPGDRVLGFEGRSWSALYPELLAAELPLSPFWWGSSPSSFEHSLVASGPLNWHLFETIDVLKFEGGIVEHLSTAPLTAFPLSNLCTEQMDVAGVAKPKLRETNFQNVVSWGTLPGTRIGYIYVWAWSGDAGPKFAQAIEELTQNQDSDGLIIDFRFNLGGNMFLSNAGLAMLFEGPEPTIGFASRADPRDHFKMRLAAPPAGYLLDFAVPRGRPGNVVPDDRRYEKPIAVLTGPGAVSSGDQVSLRMTFHPYARTFGKSTAAAFNAPRSLTLGEDWYSAVAVADAFRIESPHDYLTHDDFVVDERVWLLPEDVAAGKDTVVEAARRWIESQN